MCSGDRCQTHRRQLIARSNSSQLMSILWYVEIWLPICGYEGHYQVSNHGRVKSLKRKKPMLLKLFQAHAGHLCVSLYKDGRLKQAFVHRLVLNAFVGPCPDEGLMCRHLNGDPADNRVENLAWGTAKQNAEDMVRHGTSHQTKKSNCPSGHPYDQANTLWYGRKRYCRACRDIRNRARCNALRTA